MNLDEQLRAALDQEAEMQNATRTRRGRADQWRAGPPAPPQRGAGRRRRRGRGRARRRGRVRRHRSSTPGPRPSRPRPSDPAVRARDDPAVLARTDGRRLEPGTYRMFVGVDAAGATIDADLTVDGPELDQRDLSGRVRGRELRPVSAVYQPERWPPGPVAPATSRTRTSAETPQALAQQLAQLPRSTVVQPATPTEAFGHDAIHLRLRIDNDCPADQGYRVAETHRGSRGITYSAAPRTSSSTSGSWTWTGLRSWSTCGTRSTRRASWWTEIARTRDSITFVTTG